MRKVRLNAADRRRVEGLVNEYKSSRNLVERFQHQVFGLLANSSGLSELVHSFRVRVKTEVSLRDKLNRKCLEAKRNGNAFRITRENLLTEVNDLAGLRILHLYPRQIREIDQRIRSLLLEEKLDLREEPFARTWDDEYRDFFRECGFAVHSSPSLYTSVHYVVESGSRRTTTCEIQVRTLMEEVWGEVNHGINYPHEVDSLACREQLKVLARVTSSATRLVDSIILTYDEHRERDGGSARLRNTASATADTRSRGRSGGST